MVTSLLRSSAIIIYDFMVKIPPLNGQTDRESAKKGTTDIESKQETEKLFCLLTKNMLS